MYALIHNSQLILGPIKYNYRLINSELEELEVERRVSPRDYENVPISLDNSTHLVLANQIIPNYDSRFQSVGNFEWEIITENNIPIRVDMTYEIGDKTLEQIKEEYKSQVAPIRREKENTYIEVVVNGNTVTVSTSREERNLIVNKIISLEGTCNYKFANDTWLEVVKTDLENILSQIDTKIQEAFDWEYSKIQEIDTCTTGEEVYQVVLR